MSGAAGRLVVVCGPTGTGKSELGIELALRLDGEVINADSMQLYRGMDIGTAKVPVARRHGVEHHLLDVLEVTETASVAVYQAAARAQIERLLTAGRTPVLVGGSGLYVQAVIDEIAFPGTDPAVREKFLEQVQERGAAALHAELAAVDPAAAAAIQPGNGRRIARALEVIEITGQPFTATMPVPGPARYDAVILTLDRPTEQLDRRLAERVDAMLAAGFLDEVTGLIGRGLRQGSTARRALGYAQLIEVVDGIRALPDATTDTVTATRRFVRRQRSWFRRDARRHDLDATDPALLDAALALVGSRIEGHP
ncbi:tRNA (adenosine(37)-N6)-dimethylallyltransferase MiaA [Nakamurella lactea]|uniref:tRNA (adenosine(37)-N6)-dimethylallyltransferase MiaA n=1 Tax=Nakamurella lactea TaxID=459515 RepID=UPI000418568A|nr:tRNA (adenosine(37)-N6)-dimethylallyltransferase MiaA [Nakamurella lactea]